MDLRPAYHEHQRDTRAQLVRARAGVVRKDGTFDHRVRLPISDLIGEVNTYRMSDQKIADLALRDAEFTMNIAQHQHNAEIARKARGH
jgi:hypothetical protein